MKKIVFGMIPLLVITGFTASAQEDVKKKQDKKETQEIIIRPKANAKVDLNIKVDGDQVTINGKPLVEFKDDNITVNKRKVIVRDGDKVWFGEGRGEGANAGSWSWSDEEGESGEKTAFLGVTTEKEKDGAKIIVLTPESAASIAGLKEGDVIIKVADEKIDGPETLSKVIKARKPNDEVKIIYLRDGKEKSLKATLKERKSNRKVFSYSSPDGSHKTLTLPAIPDMDQFDFDVNPRVFSDNFNYSFPRRQKLGLRIQDTEEGKGVKVLEVEDSSAAATAGVKKDDVVTEIGGVKVENTDDAREQLHENAEKSTYTIKALRNGKEMSFDIKIPKKLKTANL